MPGGREHTARLSKIRRAKTLRRLPVSLHQWPSWAEELLTSATSRHTEPAQVSCCAALYVGSHPDTARDCLADESRQHSLPFAGDRTWCVDITTLRQLEVEGLGTGLLPLGDALAAVKLNCRQNSLPIPLMRQAVNTRTADRKFAPITRDAAPSQEELRLTCSVVGQCNNLLTALQG